MTQMKVQVCTVFRMIQNDASMLKVSHRQCAKHCMLAKLTDIVEYHVTSGLTLSDLSLSSLVANDFEAPPTRESTDNWMEREHISIVRSTFKASQTLNSGDQEFRRGRGWNGWTGGQHDSSMGGDADYEDVSHGEHATTKSMGSDIRHILGRDAGCSNDNYDTVNTIRKRKKEKKCK